MQKKQKEEIIIIKEAEDSSLYKCDSEKLSEYFVKRQIDDYCISTQGVIPN